MNPLPHAPHRAAPTIDRVETLLLDLPTIRPHRLSVATMQGQTLMLVRLHCSDGVVGVGEGTTIGGLAYGAESPEGMKLAIDRYLAPLLTGADASGVQALMQRIGKQVKGNHFAKCAVETALLDAQGKRVGLPLSELLGGRLRERLPVAWTLASGDTARDIAEAEQMLDLRRHQVFKLKIGARPPADDIAHVAAIKRALGARGAVRVDVNMAWSEAEAVRALPALADAGCELVEQPVASRDAMQRLMQRFPLALMADEILAGPESAFLAARAPAADVFAVKIEPSGGPIAAQKVAAIAEAAGIGLYGGTMLEGPIGTIASAQVFATFPQLQWGTELFGPLLLTEHLLTEPLRYADFHLHLPTGPGLGIALDEAQVQAFRRDRGRSVVAISAAAED
ncbi:muconate/chloromuconate family cycloisomerase [Xanthomonas rydalmerensis]|uniref:Muconate/chloromuconate family cycloisomerase n=1 Tax=Xanthomonas rydalmerensis TaxID=3046274 RepID=A0ABZ0JMY7_9XANT|nr:muconate/chloromuconate family cycloisomerase [Xanthomonas sp. DM-2023]WOS40395.1 muconate/chloromuconate family cycloisomerase [Xanthomonas sp. DM-2023]WOS44579.1 muconate/chloromuconate family cycloisomerase [Xanthomonas sp. DM-2023]WOS48759.1 muconate/chloromuconate family cycloisomerase [Xanthomonas sp. DM-2023]WOS52939.1 muconate/chloromuconate family cycloisomerase [Xanthomonas sp. DM-2023]WOS57123.1 muconate/chloromuconate family cycloisomerase [Xanthomonas sp. DM-2023]